MSYIKFEMPKTKTTPSVEKVKTKRRILSRNTVRTLVEV